MRTISTYLLLSCGIGLQIWNIYVYYSFLRKSANDILTEQIHKEGKLSLAALILLLSFLGGYIFVTLFGNPSLIIGCIFFLGALFCTIMIRLVIQLTRTVKKRSIDIVKTLIKVIEERDANLNGHSLYVQNVTMVIWHHLPDHLRSTINEVDLNYAALLHDVGKMGIPEAILNKPGKLDDKEWQVMREHPRKGVEILNELQSFDRILPWILYHHERIDGKGYYSLPGKDVPLEARIIAIADTYSAITMRRSYKAAKTYNDAIAIMKDAAGTQLDADLVKLFCTIPREELDACVPDNIETGDT